MSRLFVEPVVRGRNDDWELKTLEVRTVQERHQTLYETLAAAENYEIVSVDEFLPEDRSV